MGNNTIKHSQKYILPTLVLTVIIDFMGVGIIYPLLPSLFMEDSSSLVSLGTSISVRYIYYSIAITLWPIGAFFGTPYLGEISDKYGRKNILFICLIVTGLSYVLSVVAIYMNSLMLFFLSRLLSGFFGGCYDIAQAATADISAPREKARNMGWITLGFSLGMILGPIIAGLTSSSATVKWFSITTPFWIAAILSIFNAVLVLIFLNETFKSSNHARVKIVKVFSSCMFIFKDKHVQRLAIIFLLLNMGWSFFVSSAPLILNNYFNQNITSTGFFFCFLGFGSILAILFVQKPLLKYFTLKNIYISMAFISGLLLVLNFFYPTLYILWISAFIFALFEVLCYSSLLAMCSNTVSDDIQGKLMGGLGAVSSVAFVLSGIFLPILSDVYIILPILVAGAAYLVSVVLMFGHKPIS